MSKKFLVYVEEIHIKPVLIEANDKDDASEKVREGNGEYIGINECSSTINESGWKVDEINKDAEAVVDEDFNCLRINVDCKYYGNECQPDSNDICVICIDYAKKGMQ